MNQSSSDTLKGARPSLRSSKDRFIPKRTVFVGMSGGVDSSVSALLLKEQGYNVIGVYMKNWSKDLPGMKCPWAEDLADAKRVAVKLGIPFEVWDFEEAYREKVVEYMLSEFRKGNTPNPDVMCNQEIKFKLFYEKAMAAGADFIATGHYARVLPAGPSLMRAVDENKDQTYFLYRISDEALAHTIFPIGDMMKPDVKKLAEENGLHNAYKKESMGVCFVGEVGMKDFLKEYIDIKPGEIREIESEKVLGYHEGAVFYTIGQRHGLYLNGVAGEINDGLPYYVVKKDIEKNIVYVSKNLNDENIWADELHLKDVALRSDDNHEVLVRLRHRAPLIPAIFDGNTLKFEQKIKRPASGQSAVLYNDEICIGGGIIA
ncbi:tRNA 2-thiouridine(34) synthase MnmA [Candidatus Saccharibacteria bacterium]|nr:tRNA 2-thiouridine(34) synthase MnmA [Candidatus Saccharibacteria bacterium]